eukprot:gene18137-21678_t
MFAQHQMMPTFKPAMKYIFTRNSKFEFVVKYHDEFFYSLLLLLEYHYLKYYEGSFSENFYNLKRELFQSSRKTVPLLKRLWNPQLQADVDDKEYKKGLETIQRRRTGNSMMYNLTNEETPDNAIKLRHKHPINALGLLDESPQHPFIKVLRKIFLKLYPIISATYESSFFIYQLLYLYEYTDYYTPFLHMQKIILKRLTHEDINSHTEAVKTRRNERINMVRNWPMPYLLTPIVKVLDSVLDYSKFILPASVFLFKSLEWWYSENRSSPPSLPIPPPPSPPKRAPNGLIPPADKSVCALCVRERTNPAICGSGFVFCYPCIHKYVQQHGKCPITFLPTGVEQLRKIYETM